MTEIQRVAVVGAGLMGHGIAQEFALAGFSVRLYDTSQVTLDQVHARIASNLEMLTAMNRIPADNVAETLSRIETSAELANTITDADLVIEAAPENLEIKQALFRQFDALCPPHAILASNTSTFLPGKLAAVTTRPDKVLVMHYFNPPYLLPLVEVVRHPAVSDETVTMAMDLLRSLGKSPVLIQKELPGFIGNRLQIALLREAAALVEQGVATPDDVDTVIKTGFGRRLACAGIFEIFDLAGWDVINTVAEQLLPEIEASQMVSPLLRERVDREELGAKTGKGFYDWTPERALERRRQITEKLLRLAQDDSPL